LPGTQNLRRKQSKITEMFLVICAQIFGSHPVFLPTTTDGVRSKDHRRSLPGFYPQNLGLAADPNYPPKGHLSRWGQVPFSSRRQNVTRAIGRMARPTKAISRRPRREKVSQAGRPASERVRWQATNTVSSDQQVSKLFGNAACILSASRKFREPFP